MPSCAHGQASSPAFQQAFYDATTAFVTDKDVDTYLVASRGRGGDGCGDDLVGSRKLTADRRAIAIRRSAFTSTSSPARAGRGGKATLDSVVQLEVCRVAVTSPALAQEARLATATVRRRRFNLDRFLSPLLLAPSAVVIFIFVYGFIGYTFFVSLTNWKSAKPDMTIHRPVGAIYPDLFSQTRFQIDLRNTVVFTVAFLIMAVLGGLGLAILLDRHIRRQWLLPQCLSLSVRTVVHYHRGRLALDLQSGDRRQSAHRRHRNQ